MLIPSSVLYISTGRTDLTMGRLRDRVCDIQVVSGSNLSGNTDYSEVFRSFPIFSRLLSTSFTVHHLFIGLPYDTLCNFSQ
jgi:hypothetical protein